MYQPTTKRLKPVAPLRPRLAVDFDGVLHGYSKGWQGGSIYDPPVEGTAEALRQLDKRYEMVVFTARTNLDDVRTWLRENHMDHFFKDVTNKKPMAKYYLDDRGFRFVDWIATLSFLLSDAA